MLRFYATSSGGRSSPIEPSSCARAVYLQAYVEGAQLGLDPKGYLFRTAVGRRAEEAGIRTRIGCHTFRATGITEYLRNGGELEIAQQMANHESARTSSGS